MKRHHIAALFLLIFGGLFAYLRFYTGDTDGAIRTAIIFAVLGVLLFFPRKIAAPAQISWTKSDSPNCRGGICLSGFHGWGYGECGYTRYPDDFRDSYGVFFKTKPLIKNNIEPWLKPVSRIGLVVSFLVLVVLLLLLFFLR